MQIKLLLLLVVVVVVVVVLVVFINQRALEVLIGRFGPIVQSQASCFLSFQSLC